MIKPQNLKSLSIRNCAELSAELVLKDLHHKVRNTYIMLC